MTYTATLMHHLPDPDTQPEFYDGVTGKRLFAWLVDTAVILSLSALAVVLTAFIGLFFLPVLYLILGFAYRVVTIANRSATWGMRLAAIEFRDARGERFDLGQALFHTFGYTLSLAVPVLQVISVVLMLTGARGQGLTDHAMGSVAVNRRA